jgi:hypothetical protein
VAAVSAGIPLNLVQKWLGHAQLSTTAIYANAVGAEEKDIAQRMLCRAQPPRSQPGAGYQVSPICPWISTHLKSKYMEIHKSEFLPI